MPPRIKTRTADGYRREVEGLLRLRAAVVLDAGISQMSREALVNTLDSLIDQLQRLIAEMNGTILPSHVPNPPASEPHIRGSGLRRQF